MHASSASRQMPIRFGSPMQAMPVERHITGAAMSGEAGLAASSFWDLVKNAATTVLPIARQIAGGLL